MELQNDAQLYVFSDGYQDQFGGESNRKFMAKRFRDLIYEHHHLPLKVQKEKLTQVLDDWIEKGSQAQNDDILVIGIAPFGEEVS